MYLLAISKSPLKYLLLCLIDVCAPARFGISSLRVLCFSALHVFVRAVAFFYDYRINTQTLSTHTTTTTWQVLCKVLHYTVLIKIEMVSALLEMTGKVPVKML